MNSLVKLIQHYAKVVLLVAAVLLTFGVFYGGGVFQDLTKDEGGLTVEGSQSNKAHNYIKDTFGGDTKKVFVLFSGKDSSLSITDKKFTQAIKPYLNDLEDEGAQILSFYSTGATDFVSKDWHSTYVVANFSSKSEDEIYKIVKDFSENASNKSVKVGVGGSLMANRQVSERIESDLEKAELISLPILLVLLIIIFRSVVAAILPIVLGIVAVIGGTSVVRLLTNVVEVDQYAINVITVLGLGLSIDYSLLMVSRFREELHSNEPLEAIKKTMHSSGRTIFFSGLIVMISLLGLTIFPIDFLRSVGIGGVAAIFIALIAALTILPSLLLLLGRYINKGRIIKKREGQSKNYWLVLGKTIIRWPFMSIALAAAAILVMAMPLSHINIKASGLDYKSLPKDSSSREVARSLSQDFENNVANIEIVYKHKDSLKNKEGIGEIYDATSYLRGLEGVSKVEGLTADQTLPKSSYQSFYPTGPKSPKSLSRLEGLYLKDDTTYIKVFTKDSSTSQRTQDLVQKIRQHDMKHGELLVDGPAAIEYDVRESIKNRGIIALALVMVTMVVLLSILLRSIVIPLQAVIINTFSLLAAFGVLVWVFQDGNLTNFGWFLQTGSLDLTILVLIFSITLGLSMDYATFFYGRAREEYDLKKNTEAAILGGLTLTGPVISQAAILLFVVVVAFATSGIAMLQQIGLGIAVAVLVDAFIVRLILVPAVMKITGKYNWYYPKFLRKINIRHE